MTSRITRFALLSLTAGAALFATAARADLVAWLDRGKLRALRPHHELWADPGYRSVFTPGAVELAAADG